MYFALRGLFALILYVIGFYIVGSYEGWQEAVGLFLCLWATNIFCRDEAHKMIKQAFETYMKEML